MEQGKQKEILDSRTLGRILLDAITSLPTKLSGNNERGVWYVGALEAEQIAVFTDPATWEVDENVAQAIRQHEIDRRNAELTDANNLDDSSDPKK